MLDKWSTTYQIHDMNDLERAIVDVIRMALRGDVDSIQQYGRRLLRRAATGQGPEGDFREALGEVLITAEAARPALRRGAAIANSPSGSPRKNSRPQATTQPDDGPVDPGTALRLVRINDVAEGRRPILTTDADRAIDALIQERVRAAELRALGVVPSRSVLLTGAPGVGKTMTAAYLAAALKLPLLEVDLAAVMSSFLGRTGQNLRQVLDFARQQPCVLLLDEFDALAKRRDDQTDVGELKRIVNVLLLELEAWPEHGVLIAATNHPELLDRAIWRRFDVVVPLQLPDLPARRRILEEDIAAALGSAVAGAGSPNASRHIPTTELDLLSLVTDGASGSDLSRLVRAVLRDAALTDRSPAESLMSAAEMRVKTATSDPVLRTKVARLAVQALGWSQRKTGDMLGVSHVTVGNWLREDPTPSTTESKVSPRRASRTRA